MTQPKALIVRTSGTNCEDETQRAFRWAGAETELVHFHHLLEHQDELEGFDMIVFPGGFSYGDDIAAGRVWGLAMRTQLKDALRRHVDRGGLALGVCNGFQVLVESGILEPDKQPSERTIALTGNQSNHYECRWVELETQACACPWLTAGERMPTPVAHAEGRFVVRDDAALKALEDAGQIALTYVHPTAGEEIAYPFDPNGSVRHIAGICDPTGRVLGLMPHPERNLTPWNHPAWTRLGRREEGEGLAFYRRMVEVATEAQAVS